ncbi:MAG: phosphoesterase [Candidatus Nitrosocaldaceae archaeon]|nr:MAG: phosphoesterase [Candidatus Nitrosocaldaceae archaeon]GIU71776.1 MAG: phosphoesterase [Candidatus Nitrosocaldaceae archaeon]
MKKVGLFQHIKKDKNVLITTHRHADIDAYCSVYALSKILDIKGIKSKVYFPNGLNEDAKRISLLLPLTNRIDMFEDNDIIIILDTNNPALLADITDKVIGSKSKKIIIDHHPLMQNSIDGIQFIDTKASSTCEIICRLTRKSKIKYSKDIASALLLGIFTDSQYLSLAKEDTLRCVNYLSKYVSLSEIKGALARERNYSERMARLKSAKRMELYKIINKELIIAVSKVGSYHASAAKALIDLGADLSIVINKDDIIKVSMRASNRFYSLTNLHLGIDIASKISDKGGGHPTAASFISNKEDAYRDVFEIIKSMNYKISKIKI